MPYESTGNVCDWMRYSHQACEAKPTFQIKTTHDDRWLICDEHVGKAVKYVAPSAPLTVEPIFSNWAPTEVPGLMATQCNALFCVLEPHEGDQHRDVTGHTWTEPTPEHEVIAHVYSFED